MKPNLDLDLFDSESTVPFENDYLEYKENMSDGIAKNIHESICAFLNRNGGYVIVGISDDRTIVGVNMKLYDRFVNNTVDSIYNQALIVKNERDIINPFMIKINIYTNKQNKTLFILDITTDLPKLEYGYRSEYSLKCGSSFFRLNASNKRLTSSNKLFLFKEVESLKISRIEAEKIKLEKLLSKSITKYNELNRINSELEIENEKLKINLKIIKPKDKYLLKNKQEFSFKDLLSCFFKECYDNQ